MLNLGHLQEQLDLERRKVDVDHFDVTIREIVRMTTEGELLRAPAYQRKFRWDTYDESRLIESLFLGLPVPSIFVATNPDGVWELVDGLQRVSTLMHYTAPSKEALAQIYQSHPLKLADLEKLSLFNGLSFQDLPTPLQLAFYKRSFRVTALSDKSDLVARFDLFERLNTGGIALSPQEVRACIFRGQFSEFIRTLASNKEYKSLLKLQEKRKNDGTNEELILKLFAYLYHRERFDGNVKGFLNDYMEKSTKDFDYDGAKKLFEEIVSELASILDGPFLRKGVNVTPLNQLEAVMVGAAEIIKEGGKISKPKDNWLEDETLIKYSTGGTNTRQKLIGRITRAKELMLGIETKAS